MQLILSDIRVRVENDRPADYLKAAAEALAIDVGRVTVKQILSKALDSRDTEQFYYRISLVVSIAGHYENRRNFPGYAEQAGEARKSVSTAVRPLVVGFGPAGMFTALELIDYGIRPIIFERGKKIEERTIDVQGFIKDRKLNPESNIQFGEGGAGSYSDGKLFSRRNLNSSYINKVLRTFVKFGAPAEIEYISKPHLGTDVLRRIVRNIRHYILERGGEIHYSAKMTDILISRGAATGIRINGERDYFSTAIYLASGHSARDTYQMLDEHEFALEQKPISVGVRIEHPVETINLMRYGRKYRDYDKIGAATYSLNYTDRNIRRGVYTFCMCPGGEVINASSGHGLMVVNGMSYSTRSSPYSNAALAVSCHTTDYPAATPLAGLAFQENIERKAFTAGGGQWRVPAQNLLDFLNRTSSSRLHENSFKMGTVAADMRDIVPGFVVDGLVAAFNAWKEEVPLFISQQAILIGAETRTSSPVRIKRSKDYESVNVKNLYPVGEGSGYTGGITSSAADAIKAVERTVLGL